MRYLFLVLILVAVFGCERREGTGDKHSSGPRSGIPQHTSPELVAGIPEGVTYTVIDTEVLASIKRSLTVRLNKRVSEEVLRAIALELKSRDARTYDRTFICYYLPGMDLDSGAWATSHFDPNLEVRIQGLTLEEHKALSEQPAPKAQAIVGRWIDDTPFVGSRVTLFRERGKLKIEFSFKDGSVLTQEVFEKRSSHGRRLVPVEASQTGDYWVIDPQGNLQIRDNQGLISIAPKVE